MDCQNFTLRNQRHLILLYSIFTERSLIIHVKLFCSQIFLVLNLLINMTTTLRQIQKIETRSQNFVIIKFFLFKFKTSMIR